jgi:hypothetical protein
MAGDELIAMRLQLSGRLSVTTFSAWLAKEIEPPVGWLGLTTGMEKGPFMWN